MVQSKNHKTQRNPHLWIILALMAIFTISYYADELSIEWLPLGHRFFDEEYIHDIHRLLFLIPMVYCAIVFRLRGAIVISVATLCIVFPRALFFSPNPDPVLRTLIFSGIASAATISLGLERDRRLRERKAHQDHKNTSGLLTASEARYRHLFNSASDAIYVCDLKGNILEANRAMSDMTGYTTEELINMNISQIYTSESYKTTMERQERLLDGEVGSGRDELILIKKDGTTTTVDVMISVIYKNTQPAAVQASMRDVTEQKHLRDNLQYYIVEITKAQEEERKRIARELHDDTAQDLATLLLDFDAIIESKEKLSESTRLSIDQLRNRAERIMEGVRRFSHELRPAIVDQLGLLPALEWLVNEFNVSYGIKAHMQVNGSKRRFSPEQELLLFRIAQEAFRNVQKHAQASEIELVIDFTKDKIIMTIRDNGKGLNDIGSIQELPRAGKLGLIGMEERARLLGGNLRVQSEPEKGTTIEIEAPV